MHSIETGKHITNEQRPSSLIARARASEPPPVFSRFPVKCARNLFVRGVVDVSLYCLMLVLHAEPQRAKDVGISTHHRHSWRLDSRLLAFVRAIAECMLAVTLSVSRVDSLR